jgi:hypothetical protein
MFRWFAPLLLFAGKPEVLVRVLTAAIAGAVLAFGVWLLSNVAVTFDTIKNPYIVAAYGVVLVCFFIAVGTVTWLRLRRLSASRPLARHALQPAPPLPPEIVAQRAQEMTKAWERDRAVPQDHRLGRLPPASSAAAAPEPPPASIAVRATLLVVGPAYSGKTALIGSLAQATGTSPAAPRDAIRLVDGAAVEADARQLADLTDAADAADGILFIVDQDLRAPEVAAIERFATLRKPLAVVLNKADQFNAVDRDAILLSIRAKLPAKFPPDRVVAVAARPSPVEREIEDARGAVRVELRRPSSDTAALSKLLSRMFAPAPGRMLRFEAAPAALPAAARPGI